MANKHDVSVVEGELKEIQSVDVKKLLSKDLRTVCSRLKIRGVKNATKSVMIERIVEYHGNKEKYANVAKALATSKTRKDILPILPVKNGIGPTLSVFRPSYIRRRILPPLRTALRQVSRCGIH